MERLRLIVAKQEAEIARLKKDIGWKELAQTRNTLLQRKDYEVIEELRIKYPRRFPLPDHGYKSVWVLQMEGAAKATKPV